MVNNVNYLSVLENKLNTVGLPNSYVPSSVFNQFVGVDRLLNTLNDLSSSPKTSNYPPYNIRKDSEYKYTIEMAVAGFNKEEIEITINEGKLTVVGSKKEEEEVETSYIHKGIANRDFTREFILADTVEVNNASMENGILLISLENVIPEHKKMRKLEIL